MKKYFVLALFCSFSILCVFAQSDSTKLFFTKKFPSSVFVELGSRFNQVNASSGMDIDFSLSWLAKHKYYVGAAYNQLASEEFFMVIEKLNNFPVEPNISSKIKYQTAGLRFGYIFFENQKVVSFSPDLTVSWAGIKIQTAETEKKLNGASLSPALKGVFNISDYFRLGVSLHYQVFIVKKYDAALDNSHPYAYEFSGKDLSGIGGGVFMRIGKF
jgi:hypothetical protein